MTDKYIGFKYRGKSLGMSASSDFKGFIENNGADLKFFNTPTFTNEFTPIAYGDKTIYTGNTKNNKTFNFLIHLVEISLADYKSFLNWLNLDSIGVLSLDYDSSYGYDVKVLSISEGTFKPFKDCEEDKMLYYVELQIAFITTYDWAAKWIKTIVEWTGGTDILIDNDEGIPFVVKTGNNFAFNNRHQVDNYFTVTFTGTLLIKEGSTTLVNIVSPAGKTGLYYSEFGMALNTDGTFIGVSGSNPLQGISIPARTIKTLEITAATITSIKPVSREIL